MRTYAPRGQTPILQVSLTKDHLSVISGITPEGKLFHMVREVAFHGEELVIFLRFSGPGAARGPTEMLRHLTGTLLILWDGSPIHRSQVVKQFLREGGAERIHLEQLPGYAPDLNADEGIWNYLKHVELRNVCCRDLAHLKQELRRAVARLRHKRHIIQACIQQTAIFRLPFSDQ